MIVAALTNPNSQTSPPVSPSATSGTATFSLPSTNVRVTGGSDKSAIEQAILKTRKNGAMSLPPVTLTFVDGKLNVAVPDVAEGETGGEVWLFGLVKAATIMIGRGENKGRTVTYHNVVRRWIKLGDWSGKASAWSVPVQKLKGDGVDEAAVLVQGGTAEKPKAILGGTLAAIH